MSKYYSADWGFWDSDVLETYTAPEIINKNVPNNEIWFINKSVNSFWDGFYNLYKESKMKEKVEMPSKETILAVARKCPDAAEVLKGLWREVFEEEKKEIELKDGQIYQHINGDFYVLIRHTPNNTWKLIYLKNPSWNFGKWNYVTETKEIIAEYFTLCPNAKIKI